MKIVRIAKYEEHPSEFYKTTEGILRSGMWDAWRDFIMNNYNWEEKDGFKRDLFCEGFSLDGIRNPPATKEMWLFGITLTHSGSETMDEAADAIRKGEYSIYDLDYGNNLMPLVVAWYVKKKQLHTDLERLCQVLAETVKRAR